MQCFVYVTSLLTIKWRQKISSILLFENNVLLRKYPLSSLWYYFNFMKKVRFQSPVKRQKFNMDDSECHSPRPFIERTDHTDLTQDYPRVLPYNRDPIQRYETSNSSPYPMVHKLHVPSFPEKELCWKPSDDLNLSLLDASNHEPRQPAFCRSVLKETDENKIFTAHEATNSSEGRQKAFPLPSIENNTTNCPPNVLVKDNSFFIRRGNLDKYHLNINPIQTQLNKLNFGKENVPLARKAVLMKTGIDVPSNNQEYLKHATVSSTINDECVCHHCAKNIQHPLQPAVSKERQFHYYQAREQCEHIRVCSTPRNEICSHCDYFPPPVQQNVCKTCCCHTETPSPKPQNAVDKKTWAIKKYEQSKQPECMEVEKQTNVSKEKREPTVADLFKIIKLQNEQLQLLQEKVDKFMSSSKQNSQPTITCSTEHVAVNTVENDQNKMSVGVMTSFEMIRTSTVINKELMTQTNENAQIQCNKSKICIKEVVSKPANGNFLDGIIHKNAGETKVQNEHNVVGNGQQTDNVCEEKTLNELSLYNVQVDNATTPLLSPDQTLYLDVRDYSDSEASGNDQSNVGWTYYNKVMTHVNGMLQDSEMPSSASAMYRNMRQQCVQMHIDKTNVSVTKRVKFGDDPLGLHQPHHYTAPATETSLKMNQLAAKYLKNMPAQAVQHPVSNQTAAPIDMSFATRNYMEKHRLLQGLPADSKSPQAGEIPRFLDITALKQQPKFL